MDNPRKKSTAATRARDIYTSLMSAPDERTVNRVYRALYQLYWKGIFRFVLGIIRDIPTAEEATQDTFFKVFKSIHSRFDGRNLTSWIFHIAKHVAIDARISLLNHRLKHRPEIDLNDYTHPDGTNPHQEAELSELRDIMHTALQNSSMRDKHKNTLALIDLYGFSYQEAADILDVSPKTIAGRLLKARKVLSAKLHAAPRASAYLPPCIRHSNTHDE